MNTDQISLTASATGGEGISLECFTLFGGFGECISVADAQVLVSELQAAISKELSSHVTES